MTQISIDDFNKVDIRVGTIIDVKENKKSRNPAYVLTIDLGAELDTKKSSAQITDIYSKDDLVGKQVLCCVNLTPIHIGSVKSEVRVLGVDTAKGCVLVAPDRSVINGDKLF